MKPLVQNAADEKQVSRAREREKRGRERELDDMNSILSTPSGRRTLWRYLSECGIYRTSNSSSTSQTFFYEGRREIGLRILADITEANPDALIVMMKEAKQMEKE